MASNKINYIDFDSDSIYVSPPTKKEYTDKSTNKPGNYLEQKIQYKYTIKDNNDSVITNNFLLELGEVFSFGVKETQYGNKSTTFIFDISDKTELRIAQIIREIHNAICKGISPHKKVCENLIVEKLPEAIGERSRAEDGVRGLLFWATNEEGEKIDGKNPMMTINVDKGTIFALPNGERIPTSKLMKVRFKSIPLIQFTHIYSKGKLVVIKARLSSAIITEISQINGLTLQKETMDKLMQNRPDMVNDIMRDLATNSNATTDDPPNDVLLQSFDTMSIQNVTL